MPGGGSPRVLTGTAPMQEWGEQDWAAGKAELGSSCMRAFSRSPEHSEAGMALRRRPGLSQGRWAFEPLYQPIKGCRLPPGERFQPWMRQFPQTPKMPYAFKMQVPRPHPLIKLIRQGFKDLNYFLNAPSDFSDATDWGITSLTEMLLIHFSMYFTIYLCFKIEL